MKLTRKKTEHEQMYDLVDQNGELKGTALKAPSETTGADVWHGYAYPFRNSHTVVVGEYHTLTQAVNAVAAWHEANANQPATIEEPCELCGSKDITPTGYCETCNDSLMITPQVIDPEQELAEMEGVAYPEIVSAEYIEKHFQAPKHNTPIVLAETSTLSREEWLKLRTKGIGGSDASAIAGMSRYKSRMAVYMDKTGEAEPEDLSNKEAVKWGILHEPTIAMVFVEETGLEVYERKELLQHPVYPFMLANLDREIYCPVRGWGLLEIKTTNEYMKGEWDNNNCPDDYFLQVQHYLAVTGYDYAYIAVLIGGNKFRKFEIERDEAIIQSLIEMESDFWLNHVEAGIPPKMDGSESTEKLLKRMYPESEPGKRVDLVHSWPEHLAEAQRIADAAAEEVNRIKNEIKNAMGEAEEAYVNGVLAFTWKTGKAPERFDSKAFKKDHPELATQYTKQGSPSRTFNVK